MTIFQKSLGQSLAEAAVALRARVARSPRARAAIYRLRNRLVFADLYQHDRMLADQVRVDAYHEALTKHISPHDVVADARDRVERPDLLRRQERQAGARDPARADHRGRHVRRPRQRHHQRRVPPGQQPCVLAAGASRRDHPRADRRRPVRREGGHQHRRPARPSTEAAGRIYPALLELFIEPVQLSARHARAVRLAADRPARARLQRSQGARAQAAARLPAQELPPVPVRALPLPTGARREGQPHDGDRGLAADGDRLRAPRDGLGPPRRFVVYFTARFDEQISFTSSPDAPGTSWGTFLMRCRAAPCRSARPSAWRCTPTTSPTPGRGARSDCRDLMAAMGRLRWLGWGLALCALVVAGPAVASAQALTVSSWSAPERLGPDHDGDGLVDLPSTPAQVTPATWPIDITIADPAAPSCPATAYSWTIDGAPAGATRLRACVFRLPFPSSGRTWSPWRRPARRRPPCR